MNQFEDVVRSALTVEAEGAPLSTYDARHRVVGAAGLAQRARRRRGLAAAGSALAAVLVAGAFTALAAPDRLRGHDGDPVVASPAQHPTLDPNQPLGVLRYRGVEVTVPESMLGPGTRQCGNSVKDAAWIWHPHGTTLTCAAFPKHPEDLAEVQLAPAGRDILHDQMGGVGTVTIKDGRTQVIRLVRERDVQLTVIAPDRARAEAIASTLRVLTSDVSAEGCTWQAPHNTPEATDTTAPIAPAAPNGGLICSYVDGWLEGAATLDRSEARALARQFRAAPQRLADPGCLPPESPTVQVTSSFVLVTLEQGGRPTRIWMHAGKSGSQCEAPAGVNDRGRTVELVCELAIALLQASYDDAQDGFPQLYAKEDSRDPSP